MTTFLAGLALGVSSSAHCAAMCGPLVLTIGRRAGRASRRAQLQHVLLYHAGRVTTYIVLALPAGLLGESLVLRGLGRGLAIGAGVTLLAAAMGSVRVHPGRRMASAYSRLLTQASAPLLHWAARRPVAGPVSAGALNGLLPCGLVYAALTTAAAAGSPANAMLLMAGFGAGTAGVLIMISVGAASVPPAMRPALRPLRPIVLAITAAILIARGVAGPHHHPIDSASVAHHSYH